MDSKQSSQDIVSRLRTKHVNICIINTMLLKHVVSSCNELFPSELIFLIIDIMWCIMYDRVLDVYLYHNRFNKSQNDPWVSNLKLYDIVDSISNCGKVSIFKTQFDSYIFYIKFTNPINCDRDKQSAFRIRKDLGKIIDSPFIINYVGRKFSIDSQYMCGYISKSVLMHIDNYLYTLINREQPQLSKYYYVDVGSCQMYRFDDVIYKNEHESTKEAKRQIMILWLKDFSKRLRESGIYLDNGHHEVCESATIDKILAVSEDYQVIYK